MSIFSWMPRRRPVPWAKGRRQTGLTRDVVIAAFELMLDRPPLHAEELAAALDLRSVNDLVEHLIKTPDFRDRYLRTLQSAEVPALQITRRQRRDAIFLGDRVLCWTHRGQPIYLVPQDVDLTPRILRDGAWETHVEEIMLRFVRPGHTVVDLGANVGYYTIILAAAVAPQGKVYAFEAHPDLVRLLKATIHFNGISDLIELNACAISDHPGTLDLAVSPDHYGSGNLVPPGFVATYDEHYPNRVKVPAATLDTVLGDRIPAVDFLHMDIEGAEPMALHGAQALLERSPGIRIVTEWSVGMMAMRVDVNDHVAWLRQLGFRFWTIDRETAALTSVEASALPGLPHGDLLMSRTELG